MFIVRKFCPLRHIVIHTSNVLDSWYVFDNGSNFQFDIEPYPYKSCSSLCFVAKYLMKLRYGDEFGKSSGSTWRLLFVFALMPWMRRYRILSDDSDVFEEALQQKLALKNTRGESNDAQVKESNVSKAKESDDAQV